MVTMWDPVQGKNISFHVSPFARKALDNVKEVLINRDQDRLWIIDGLEGSGKSTIAMQFCKYVDPTFCIDDVCMNSEDLDRGIRKAKPHTCKAKLLDEGFLGLSSRGAMSKANKKLIQLLMQARQKNLFLVVAIPSIFMLDRYASLHRSKALIHVTEKRGKYMFHAFNYNFKKKLILEGSKGMSYGKTIKQMPLKCRGHFFGNYVIDEKLYRAKKIRALNNPVDSEMSEEAISRNKLIYLLHMEYNLTGVDVQKLMEDYGIEIQVRQVQRIIKREKEIKKEEEKDEKNE